MFDRYGFQPAVNALVMGMSVVVGLSSYALTWHLGETKEIEPQDSLALLHMFMFLLWVFVFVICIEAIRSLTRKLGTRSDSKNSMDGSETHNSTTQVDRISEEIYVDSLLPTSDDSGDDDDSNILVGMVRGRIGCRPDLAFEFGKITTAANAEGNGGVKDVAVLACGPMAMVKSITQICNKPNSCCAWGLQQADGSDLYFTFTEEDWEW